MSAAKPPPRNSLPVWWGNWISCGLRCRVYSHWYPPLSQLPFPRAASRLTLRIVSGLGAACTLLECQITCVAHAASRVACRQHLRVAATGRSLQQFVHGLQYSAKNDLWANIANRADSTGACCRGNRRSLI